MPKPEIPSAQDSAVYLIDASVYIFRGYFALPSSIADAQGRPANAVHGFADFLAGFLAGTRPQQVAVAFDESLETSFRNELYPDYKANREPAPADLKYQFQVCRAMVEALGLVGLSSNRYEADDLIATLASRAQARGKPVVILTRDKDLAQLLQPNDRLWDYAGDVWLDAEAVADKFGVGPQQMLDFQALVGDAVDNIPGIRGIGPKAAAALLLHFGDLDSLYERLDEVPELTLRGARRLHTLLSESREMALLSRELCRMVVDAELPETAHDLSVKPPVAGRLEAFCDEWGLGGRLRSRLLSLTESV